MRKIVLALLLALAIVFLLNSGCKKAGEIYTLTVVKGDGISGFPEAGVYTYELNSMVFYNYDLFGAYINLKLLLDDQDAPLNGSLIMDRNHTLQATCEPIDYSGNWAGSLTWDIHMGGMCVQPEDAANENVVIVHSGDALTFVIPSLGLELKGSLYSDNYFSVQEEKDIPGDVTYKYTAHGQFVSPGEFTGSLDIVGYRGGRDLVICGSGSSFLGTKQ